jgi:hypothetical protein
LKGGNRTTARAVRFPMGTQARWLTVLDGGDVFFFEAILHVLVGEGGFSCRGGGGLPLSGVCAGERASKQQQGRTDGGEAHQGDLAHPHHCTFGRARGTLLCCTQTHTNAGRTQ